MTNESAWFAMLAGVALKSTVVLGAAWLAAFLLRGRSAASRHLVWTAAAAAVLALPFLSATLPILPVAVAMPAATDIHVMFRTTATPRAEAAVAPQTLVSGPATPASWRPDWQLCLMLLWIAGAGAAFAQILLTWVRLRILRRAASPSPDGDLSLEIARRLGIGHAVELLETRAGVMPMTCGILRPTVFLPRGAALWTEGRRRIVLLHELAHVRRGDTATQLMARLALILNWWNPLAWTAWREFLKERESATDDLVLQAGARASDYAGHLLDVARTMQAPPSIGWAAIAMARRSQLEGRLLNILDSRVIRAGGGRTPALAVTLLAIAIVAPFAAVRAQDQASQSIPPDVDATIRAAAAQKNHEMLDHAAAAFEALRQYETAQKLMEESVAIREETKGKESVDYGVGLLKIADLEKKRNHGKEAEAFYTKALGVLGDRPESAPALMYLGMRRKDPAVALDYFERAQRLDSTLAGQAKTWMAVVQERQQNPAEAEALYRSALAVEQPNSIDALNTTALFRRFLKDQGRESEAPPMPAPVAVRGTVQTNSTALKVGAGGVTAPSVLSKMDPEYSEEARFAKYAGTVVLYVEIGPDGVARNIRIVKGIGLGLEEKAVAAIEKWRFKPGTLDGAPVTVKANIEVNFRLL